MLGESRGITNCHDARLILPTRNIFGLELAEEEIFEQVGDMVWGRCSQCFDKVNHPLFNPGEVCVYHSGQYLIYLYYLSNSIYETFLTGEQRDVHAQDLCDKIFMTMQSLWSIDLYYGQKMPTVFLGAHPYGTVFSSKAQIGEYFFFTQGCNIGISNGSVPILGNGVIMWGNSKIVGNCKVGNHVVFGANSYVKDMDIPDNSIVFGQYPNVIIKENREDEVLSMLSERFYI